MAGKSQPGEVPWVPAGPVAASAGTGHGKHRQQHPCAVPSAVTAIIGGSRFHEKQAEEIAKVLASLSLEIWAISGSSPSANSKSKFVAGCLTWQ